MHELKWKYKFELKESCWVFVPTENSLVRGQEIKEEIESKWTPPYYYYHLKSGGHVAALKKHLSSKYFIQADIEQFFNSINKSRVTRSLKKIYKDYSSARVASCDSVVLKPECSDKIFILPFGFVQSAIISSLCLHNSALGIFLDKLEGNGFKVSVYMDDIIISTSKPYDDALSSFNELQEKAEKSGFLLNKKKTNGPSDSVSSFNITLSHMELKLTDERFNEFKSTITGTSNPRVIKGILEYVKTVCPKQSKILEKETKK